MDSLWNKIENFKYEMALISIQSNFFLLIGTLISRCSDQFRFYLNHVIGEEFMNIRLFHNFLKIFYMWFYLLTQKYNIEILTEVVIYVLNIFA